MTRKICVITGSRAEYGLLRWVMQGIKDDPELTLQIVATGMHLSPRFGLTYQEIESDGFEIDRKVEMLTESDTAVGIAKSMGNGMIGFADALDELRPDIIVVLGDRFEIFSAVATALVARIPVAHIHGGELTEGNFDDALRHSITKMSHLHFVANEEYGRRVIQLGEQPDRVFVVGGLGVDGIKRTTLLDRAELEKSMDFKFSSKNLLITFHPVTLDASWGSEQFEELLAALDALTDTNFIFTMPNADTGNYAISKMIDGFIASHPNSRAYNSLGNLRYLSCIANVDGVVGNSSSGLLEVPSFKKGTVNIGDRQKGRIQATSIIDCAPNRVDIGIAIQRLYDGKFMEIVAGASNPYGNGGATEKIVAGLKNCELHGIMNKSFYDLDQ